VNNSLDVIVVGLGVHGAAAACELARRGLRVTGIDARDLPHAAGSSHGQSRIIREAYYEHPLYVPLVQRAYDVWLDIQELTGTLLYRQTGGLNAGPENGTLIRGALASVQEHDLEHELLDADEMRRRFPALSPCDGDVGVLEPRAGALFAEACLRTMLDLARGYGALIRTGCDVTSWHVDGADVVIDAGGETLRARHVVFAAGPWLNGLLARERDASPLTLPLAVERQTSHMFEPARSAWSMFAPSSCPITLLEYEKDRYVYTLPHFGQGVKAGIHHEGESFDPADPDRTVHERDVSRVSAVLRQWMPALSGDPMYSSVCLYTNTPDANFILDRHPAHERVLLLSACSGHGFKFAPALGEAVADLVMDGESLWDLSLFGVGRFAQGEGANSHG